MNCNYKVKIKDIQNKYQFKIFCKTYDDTEIQGDIDTLEDDVEALQEENAYLNNLVEQAFDKKEVEGEELTINNTIEARMEMKLNGNTSQNSEPTPATPQDIEVVTGDNTITISNSDNTEKQEFPISLGSLELCKIGDYQDYIYKNNEKWYKHKVIGKIVFDGTRTGWGFGTAGLGNMNVANINIPSMLIQNFGLGFCNCFIRGTSKKINTLRFGANDSQLWFYVNATEFTNINDWKTWLSNNNITVYYVLATPIDEEITDTTLISQLEALKTAMSYTEQTNISQINDDIHFILKITALASYKSRIVALENAILNANRSTSVKNTRKSNEVIEEPKEEVVDDNKDENIIKEEK